MKTSAGILAGVVMLASLIVTQSTGTALNAQSKGKFLVYVGTYTVRGSQGIYAYRFDDRTGQATSLGLVAKTTSPSFLAVDPSRRFLYAVNEVSDYQGQKTGAVSAFAIDRQSGKLKDLNQVSSLGAGPCFVSLDKTGRYVLLANYDSGSVAVFPVLDDGRLGKATAFVQHQGSSVNHERQEGPHAHAIEVSPDNRFALAADLGLDKLLVYRFDPGGLIEPNVPAFASIKPGSGPRHFAFHPNGHFVYVLNEMGSSISAFSYEAAQASLHELQTISALPAGFSGHS